MTPETSMKAIAGAQAGVPMADLLADAARNEALQFEAAGLYLDLRRQKLDLAGWGALVDLAESLKVGDRIAHLFAGEIVNGTEKRPALHPACRNAALLGDAPAGANARVTRATMNFSEMKPLSSTAMMSPAAHS